MTVKEFDKQGYKWNSRTSYLKQNYWNVHSNHTCYDNERTHANKIFYEKIGFKILKFEDIQLEETTRERINNLSNDDFIEWLLNTMATYEKIKKTDKYTVINLTIYEDVNERQRFKEFMSEVLEKKQKIKIKS